MRSFASLFLGMSFIIHNSCPLVEYGCTIGISNMMTNIVMRWMMTEQGQDPVKGAGMLVGASGQDLAPVARELDGRVAVLTMQHRPHNFIGAALVDALIAGVRWAAEQNARAVLLRSGLRNFCAGADVGLLLESAERGAAADLDFTE